MSDSLKDMKKRVELLEREIELMKDLYEWRQKIAAIPDRQYPLYPTYPIYPTYPYYPVYQPWIVTCTNDCTGSWIAGGK